MVNSSYYASPWFITVFTQSLQHQEGDNLSEKLLELWDYYLTVRLISIIFRIVRMEICIQNGAICTERE
jgi:hypothetical protein